MLRLCFLHIPKTAGTTVNDILFDQFPKRKIFPGQTMIDYKEKKDFSGYSLYKGHVLFSFAQEHFPADTQYITLLRDPVERALSLYYFWRNHPDEFFDDPNTHEHVKKGPRLARKLDVFQFFQSDEPQLMQATRNNQLFQLKTLQMAAHRHENREKITENVQNNLQKFSLIGIQTLLPFFIFELKKLIGIEGTIDIPYANRSSRSKELQAMTAVERDQLIQLISDYNAAEIEVYKMIESQIKERLNQYFSEQLASR